MALAVALAVSVLCLPASASPIRDSSGKAAEQQPSRTLETVEVTTDPLPPYQGAWRIDIETILTLPRGNGDLASVLRLNPNVQIDDAARSQRTPGEIRPAEISINGAPFYQNLFQVDGTSFTNDLDPVSSNPNHYADPPSATQGLAIDTSLLGALEVFDSNIPARFGGFNGGVIDARTRRAGVGQKGSVVVRHTRDSWVQDDLVDPAEQINFEQSTSAARQASFRKTEVRATVEDRTAADVGWLLSLREQQSTIPLRGAAGGFVSPNDEAVKDQTRSNRSGLLRLDVGGEGWHTDFSANLAPTNERYFIQNAKNSFFDLESGGPVISLRDSRSVGRWAVATQAGYSDLESSRRSDVDYWKSWRWSSEQNWGAPLRATSLSTEGSWGDVDQAQRTIDAGIDISREMIRWAGLEHRIAFGLEADHREAFYERLNDHRVYLRPGSTVTCTAADGAVDRDGCSLAPTLVDGRGQYFTQRDIYLAGRFEVAVRSMAGWLENEVTRDAFSLRLGLRYDRDDLMNKTTVAPRSSARWSFDDGRQALVVGINRYYGRTFFSNLLRDGRESLKITQRRGSGLLYGPAIRATSLNRFQELDIPYSNEATLGWQWSGDALSTDLRWVRRQGRDEILRRRVREDNPAYAPNVFIYVNDGRSRADVISASVQGRRPLIVGPTQTVWRASIDRTDTRRSYSDFESSLDPLTAAEPVLYRGSVIRFDELPQQNFNRPASFRASASTELGVTGFSIANVLVWRDGFPSLQVVDAVLRDGQLVDVYEERDISSSLTLDTQLEWRADLIRWTPWVRLEISNTLNRRNVIGLSAGRPVYELGRQFWLELGAKF